MNENINIRVDKETILILEELRKRMKISKSDIIRMSIRNFYKNFKKN